MLIQLQPVQISLLWENIRQSVVRANKVPADKEGKYSNRLMANLLSGKYQCWLVCDKQGDDKRIIAIGVTAIIEDHLYEVRTLDCLSLYGFRRLDEELAKDSFSKLMDYARRNNCEKIKMQTNVPRMKELIEQQGLSSNTVLYEKYI